MSKYLFILIPIFNSDPCIVTSGTVRTNDNVTFSYPANNCWTLTSANCGPKPSYAVFQKKNSGGVPLSVKAYFGGHEVEVTGTNVKINGNAVSVAEGQEHVHSSDGVEIVK